MSDAEQAAFTALEETAQFVAMVSGIKNQFIEAGWSIENAERATLLMLEKSGNQE